LFPLDISGSIELAPLDQRLAASVLEAIQNRLQAEPVSSVRRDSDSISFSQNVAQMFSLAAYRPFGFIDSGEILLEGKPATLLQYRLSTRRSLTVIMGLACVVALSIGVTERDISGAVIFVALGFFWLFGVNYLIASFRTRSLIKGLVAAARPRESGVGPATCPHCGSLYDPDDYRPDSEMICAQCHRPMRAASA